MIHMSTFYLMVVVVMVVVLEPSPTRASAELLPLLFMLKIPVRTLRPLITLKMDFLST